MSKQIASIVKKRFYVMLNGFIFTIFYIQQLSSLHTQQQEAFIGRGNGFVRPEWVNMKCFTQTTACTLYLY